MNEYPNEYSQYPQNPPYSQEPYQQPYQQPYPGSQPTYPPQPGMQAPYPPYPPQPGMQTPYPPYPPQQPKKSGVGKGIAIGCGVLVLVLVICGVIGAFAFHGVNTTTTTSTTSSSTTPGTDQSQDSGKHFKVGETVKTGDTWEVTVNSAKTSTGDDYEKPDAGNIFLIINVTTHNISSKEQIVSSLLNFKLKDSDGTEGKVAFLGTGTSQPPDGKVAAGDKAKGDLVYQVSVSKKQFTLSFQNDILQSGQTIWDINV